MANNAPTANDSIREAHSYEYDNNGNILFVNTLRLKPDMIAQPDTVQRTRDKRTVPLSHERKGARRASEAQQSEKTLTVTLSRITNAYTQSCWIANPAERVVQRIQAQTKTLVPVTEIRGK